MTATPIGQPTADSIVKTAQILLFPTRAPVPPVLLSPQARLSHALETLNAAIAEQRAALVAWREALVQLRASAAGLGQSLEQYRDSLHSLGEGVKELQVRANALRNWADRQVPTKG